MYNRVLLKLSGEALQGHEKNFDPIVLRQIDAAFGQADDLDRAEGGLGHEQRLRIRVADVFARQDIDAPPGQARPARGG